MQTFNGDKAQRGKCLERVAGLEHRLNHKEDRKLLFWTRRQWCELNCGIGDCNHLFYADEVGVPAQIAYAERTFFLSLPQSAAAKWPRQFVRALPVGVELKTQWRDFVLRTLSATEDGTINFARNRLENDAIVRCIELFEQNCDDWARWDVVVQKGAEATAQSRSDIKEMTGDEALALSGRRAAEAATNFARSVRDPRYAREAIEAAVDCPRWKSYAEHVAPHPCTRDPVIYRPRNRWTSDRYGRDWGGVGRRDPFGSGSHQERNYEAETEAKKKWTSICEAGERAGHFKRDCELARLSLELIKQIRASDPAPGVWRVLRELFS